MVEPLRHGFETNVDGGTSVEDAVASADGAAVPDTGEVALDNITVQWTTEDLKQQGSLAYKEQSYELAVKLWLQALQQLLQEGSTRHVDYANLELTLYLNLAQGHLKILQPEKALRACQIVLDADPRNPKALYRAADALFRLDRADEANAMLDSLMAQGTMQAACHQLRQEHAAKQNARQRDAKKMGRKMFKGIEGSGEGRQTATGPSLSSSVMDGLPAAGGLMDCGAEVAALTSNGTAWAGKASGYAARTAGAAGASAATSTGEEPRSEEQRSEDFMQRALAQCHRYQASSKRSTKLVQGTIQHGTKCAFLRGQQGGDAYAESLSSAREEVDQMCTAAAGAQEEEIEQEEEEEEDASAEGAGCSSERQALDNLGCGALETLD